MPSKKRRLGYPAQRVLLSLSTRGACAAGDWAAFYPLSEAQVRSAINTLGRRSLVDVAGFTEGHHGRECRTYKITSKGEAYLEEHVLVEDGES